MQTLRLSQELVLLLLDSDVGEVRRVDSGSLALALAAAVLVDLVTEKRVLVDESRLSVLDSTPTGDDLLDQTLASIASQEQASSAQYWLKRIARRSEKILELSVDLLAKQGIIGSDDLGFIASRVPNNAAARQPETPLGSNGSVSHPTLRVLATNDPPSERDIAIVGLAHASGIFNEILATEPEAAKRKVEPSRTSIKLFDHDLHSHQVPVITERIKLIAQMESIGQGVIDALRSCDRTAVRPERITRTRKEIPTASGLPIVGNAIELMGDVRKFLTKNYLKLGPVFRVSIFRRKLTVLAGVDANNFVNRYGKDLLISRGLWMDLDRAVGATRSIHSMDGPDHFRMRRLERPGYSRAAAENRIDRVYGIAQQAVNEWPLDKSIGVWHALAPIVTSQLGVVGANTNATDYLEDLRIYMHSLLMSHVAHTRPKWIMRLPRLRRARKRVEQLYASVVQSHHPGRRDHTHKDLVDDLLDMHRKDPDFMPESDLLVSVLGPFVAGLDTVTSTCSFMLYALLKNPELLALMTAECDEMFARGGPTPSSIRKLDITHRVATETMRMYPVAPATVRTSVKAFEFSGYRIPLGDTILLGTSVPHYLPEVFPNPEVFDIDRYTPGRNEHQQSGALAPFGIGSHHCLGANFAEWQVVLNLATIVHHCRVRLDPPHYNLRLKFKPNPMPDERFRIRVIEHR